MNRFDECAVEEALLIKETFPNTSVDVISVGAPRAAIVIRRALGMGADHGIHIVSEQVGYVSPFVTASWIASCAKKNNYDLILTGVMAEDDMQGQVGQMIAEFLSLPCATSTIFERLSPHKGTVYVEREIEGGARDTLELSLPAVLTIQSGINIPRYPSLSNILRAKKEKVETIDAKSVGHPESRQRVVRVEYPQKSRSGVVLEGTQQEKAAQLLEILREKSLIY
jgi:electron transfer flavoprotein beta subunit